MAVMTASLVIGSAIVLNVPNGPVIFGIDVLAAIGLAGYVAAFFNSLWVIYGIWSSRQK